MKGHHGLSTNIRALRASAVLILIYFIFEVSIAVYTGSLALLADAGHELSTFAAISISLLAVQLAARKPTEKRTFGFLRIETIAAFFNGLLLLAMAVFILTRGFMRLFNPVEIPSLPMFIMAFGGIGLEIASLIIMFKGQKESLNIRGSFWHVINAFLGSIAVIVAAIFIQLGRIYIADSWAGIIFAFILIYGAYGILKDSFNILIDVTPKDIDLFSVERDLLSIPGVTGSHHFHARTITSGVITFSGHLVIADFDKSEAILIQAKEILDKKYMFSLSTVQLEDEKIAEADLKKLEYKH